MNIGGTSILIKSEQIHLIKCFLGGGGGSEIPPQKT